MEARVDRRTLSGQGIDRRIAGAAWRVTPRCLVGMDADMPSAGSTFSPLISLRWTEGRLGSRDTSEVRVLFQIDLGSPLAIA
jgi:hypothetical protein